MLTKKFILTCTFGLLLFSPLNSNSGPGHSSEVDRESWKNIFPYKIERNSTLYESLTENGFEPADLRVIVKQAKRLGRNLSRIRPGTKYQVFFDKGPVQVPIGVRLKFSPTQYLNASRDLSAVWPRPSWTVQLEKEKISTRLVTFSGLVSSSLWESAIEAKMEPELISELTEVFAWEIDFAREVMPGDRWRLTVEQEMVGGRVIGWGRILAAEYDNSGKIYTAILFHKDGRELGYFSREGKNLRKMFLKSPLRFGRISSRFRWKRFHPILKKSRPHLGVDYAAPTGTPVRAVGDGKVILARRRGGGGKTIIIRHNSYYKTAYKHLSGYARGVRTGRKVRQGQVIGYVGSTGLSTGPHLHFEFFEGGRFVDPLRRKFPEAKPVPPVSMEEFKSLAAIQIDKLPAWYHPGVTVSGPVVVLADFPAMRTPAGDGSL